MKTKNNAIPMVLLDPLHSKAKYFGTIADAARYLKRDESTVRRALTGARGCQSVNGHLAIPVT